MLGRVVTQPFPGILTPDPQSWAAGRQGREHRLGPVRTGRVCGHGRPPGQAAWSCPDSSRLWVTGPWLGCSPAATGWTLPQRPFSLNVCCVQSGFFNNFGNLKAKYLPLWNYHRVSDFWKLIQKKSLFSRSRN